MPIVPRILIENACYHIVARGNQKQKVFRAAQDYKEYLDRLKKYKRKFDFRLYAYCLMPNHVHFVGQIKTGENLSKFMHGLTLSYTAYFNQKYTLVGHLWQGRFKNRVITKDQYLVDCISYIELNPLRAQLVNATYEYPWSSYGERVLDNSSGMLDEFSL